MEMAVRNRRREISDKKLSNERMDFQSKKGRNVSQTHTHTDGHTFTIDYSNASMVCNIRWIQPVYSSDWCGRWTLWTHFYTRPNRDIIWAHRFFWCLLSTRSVYTAGLFSPNTVQRPTSHRTATEREHNEAFQ